jgi:hypothetical protein
MSRPKKEPAWYSLTPCHPDHLIKIGDIFVKAGSLSHEEYNNCQDVYDLMNVDKNNEYFTNGIVSHNCLYLDEFAFIPKNFINEFIESTFPVISASKLARIIITSTPNGKNHFYKFYEEAEKGKSDFKHSHIKWSDMPGRDEAWRQARIKELGSIEKFNQEYGAEFADASNMAFKPDTIRHIEQVQVEDCLFEHVKTAEGLKIFQRPIKNRKYLISCDVAGGAGRDSSTMVVIDITTETFNIVSTYQSDEISTQDYPAVIYNLALYYNNAFILIENNGMGDGVANELWYNLEYNNIYSADFTKEFRFKKVYHKEIGIKTNKKNKKAGVLFLSSMLDKFQIIIPDIRIVDELYTFCKNDNGSYSASSGNHDDFVMNLVLFAYVYKDKDRFEVLKIGLTLPPEVLKERIKTRLLARIKKGMIKEVENLHKSGVSWKRLNSFGLEYRYVALFLQKKLNKTEMLEKLYTEIWHFAKRQKTWFQRDPNTLWIDPRKDTEKNKTLKEIKRFLG